MKLRRVLERERKKELQGTPGEGAPENHERLLPTALEQMDLDELIQAVSDTKQDVDALPITLSARLGSRNRQVAYLAFSLYGMRRTEVALNQVTIARPTRPSAKGRGCRAMIHTRIRFRLKNS